MAAKIAEAKQLGVTAPVEKDAASLTAEAVMRGSDAVPIALSVSCVVFHASIGAGILNFPLDIIYIIA